MQHLNDSKAQVLCRRLTGELVDTDLTSIRVAHSCCRSLPRFFSLMALPG